MTDREVEETLELRANVHGLALSPTLVNQLGQYYRLLEHWNRTINLTSLSLDPPTPTAVDRLLVEPLLAAPYFTAPADEWVDVGSGGGSPAIPLKLFRPAARLVMVESRERKGAFLREAIRTLQLDGASVAVMRFEQFAGDGSRNQTVDLITARAVRLDARLFEQARQLLRPAARIVLFGAAGSLATPPGFERIEVSEPARGSIVVLSKA